jgi:hypothetical protein
VVSITSTSTETVFPASSTGNEGRILWGLKKCPSKDLRMVYDVVSWGEPRDFQHVKDMMHVVVPSSSIVQKTFLLRDRTMICNAN